MNDAAARWTDRACTLSLQRAGRETVLITVSGELGIAQVEELAACADQVCGLPVRDVRLELSGLTAVDGPGARTLAAACQCLRLNGRRVSVRGVRREVSLVLNRLGLVLDKSGGRPPAEPFGASAPDTGDAGAGDADAGDPGTAAPAAGDPGPWPRAGKRYRPTADPAGSGTGWG